MSDLNAKQPSPSDGKLGAAPPAASAQKDKKEEEKAEVMAKTPPMERKPHDATAGKPWVCWGMCVARLGTMLFALLTAAFHLAAFLFTLAYRFAEYKNMESYSKYAGAAEADVSFEFLCLLPLATVMFGVYDSKRPNSRHIIFGGTMAALTFGVILTIVHCLSITGIVKVIQDKPPEVYKKDGKTVPSFVFPVMLAVLLVKVIFCTILYSCLAWSSLRHWHYLETLYETQESGVAQAQVGVLGSNKDPGRKNPVRSPAPIKEQKDEGLEESNEIMENDWDARSQS